MFVKLVLLLLVVLPSSVAAAAMTLDELASKQLKNKEAANIVVTPKIEEPFPARRVVSIMKGRSGWVTVVESHDGRRVVLRGGEKMDGWQVDAISTEELVFVLKGKRRTVKFGEVYQQIAAGSLPPLPPLPFSSAR